MDSVVLWAVIAGVGGHRVQHGAEPQEAAALLPMVSVVRGAFLSCRNGLCLEDEGDTSSPSEV